MTESRDKVPRRSERDRSKLERAERAVAMAPPESGVLVVEDDPDTQWRLARMLTVHGARVVGTSSGEAALAVIEQWPADLVLLDETLPGLSGLDVARRIRASYPAIPVVLMSAEESADFRVAARIAGAMETLIKPFRVEALIEILSRLKTAGQTLVAEGQSVAVGLVVERIDGEDGSIVPAE